MGGENVASLEIESFLLRHPAIAVAAVVAAPDAYYGEVPAAYLQLADGNHLTEAQVIDYCLDQIATYKVPRYVRFVDSWPMSGTKIRKVELRQSIREELTGAGITEAPACEAGARPGSQTPPAPDDHYKNRGSVVDRTHHPAPSTPGRGRCLDSIGDLMIELHLRRPIVVTDPYLRDAGALDRILFLLRTSGLDAAAFAETVPDPTTDSLTPALALIAAHRADSIIGFGGGVMDTAKALATLAIQGGEVRDHKAPAVNHGPALPVVAVPTTAGSGSEATQFTVITDTTTDEKMLCTGAAFLPIAAIVDHELTTTMPPRLTADTGIDASPTQWRPM